MGMSEFFSEGACSIAKSAAGTVNQQAAIISVYHVCKKQASVRILCLQLPLSAVREQCLKVLLRQRHCEDKCAHGYAGVKESRGKV